MQAITLVRDLHPRGENSRLPRFMLSLASPSGLRGCIRPTQLIHR